MAKVGDSVKITLVNEEVSGILLESYDAAVYLVKLDSGYNIGIPKDNVHHISVVEKASNTKAPLSKVASAKDAPTIGIVVTGGTIASKLDPKTGGVSALTNVSEFAQFYPELFSAVTVKSIEVPFMELSENMYSEHWVKIGECVARLLKDTDIEGVIITHGTDFLHYTGSALSFFLGDVNKPVVLTYSQRSSDRGSSDARLNVMCAATMATSECAEVMVVGHAETHDDYCYALKATKTRKMHTSKRATFEPINALPLAKVWSDKIEYMSSYRAKDSKREVAFDGSFSDKVALVMFYPGQKPDILDWYYDKGYKGVVVMVSGIGHVPALGAKHSWTPTIKRLVKKGFVICGAAQTLHGRLHPQVYSVGRELSKSGVIFLEDMLPETALVKLGWVLGHRNLRSVEKVREAMLTNYVGEYSEMLTASS